MFTLLSQSYPLFGRELATSSRHRHCIPDPDVRDYAFAPKVANVPWLILLQLAGWMSLDLLLAAVTNAALQCQIGRRRPLDVRTTLEMCRRTGRYARHAVELRLNMLRLSHGRDIVPSCLVGLLLTSGTTALLDLVAWCLVGQACRSAGRGLGHWRHGNWLSMLLAPFTADASRCTRMCRPSWITSRLSTALDLARHRRCWRPKRMRR
jgi:hypothetical protein